MLFRFAAALRPKCCSGATLGAAAPTVVVEEEEEDAVVAAVAAVVATAAAAAAPAAADEKEEEEEEANAAAVGTELPPKLSSPPNAKIDSELAATARTATGMMRRRPFFVRDSFCYICEGERVKL